MKTSILRRALAICLLAAVAICPNLFSVAVDDGKMAFNIYGNPTTTGGSGKYDTFSIDVEGINTPNSTYLSMCNWYLDLSGSRSRYKNISGGGAYAGIQNANGRVAIMSFWDMNYDNAEGERVVMRANRVYPSGAESSFGNEGEGNNWITSYPWVDSQWYRMVIHTWTDAETGDTFIGQWLKDLTSGKWTLISYFNTHLTNSAMTGGMSQFLENFWSGNAGYEREFHFKNIYAHDKNYSKWLSWNKSSMSCGATQTNKKGTRSFGSNGEYFWGKTDGHDLADQAAYNATAQVSGSYTITQPSAPTLDKPTIASVNVVRTAGGYRVNWTVSDTGAPQNAYKVLVRNEAGTVVDSYTATRPEVRYVDFTTEEKVFTVEVEVTDIYGQKTKVASDLVGKYKVTWNVAGTETSEYYYYGDTPSYKGETPVKAPDAHYTYTFTGWDKTFRAVTKNVTYTAVFAATERETPFGDINGDYTVSIRDVTELLQIISAQGSDPLCDLNGDGAVSISDVTALLVLLAK